jgi:DUF1009 family protein
MIFSNCTDEMVERYEEKKDIRSAPKKGGIEVKCFETEKKERA